MRIKTFHRNFVKATLTAISIFAFYIFLFPVAASAANGAQFVMQSVPSSMVAGQAYQMSVTMKNTGTSSWSETQLYRLGAQNPQDNWNWGTNRIKFASGETVAPGASKTFSISYTPAAAGTYNFQWKMVQDNVEWFGDSSPNVSIAVSRPESPLMSVMKTKGCVWDGLLSNYAGGETDSAVAMLNRSGCQYLHRAQETWAWPPDFNLTQSIMAKITKQNVIYGMNIAEAISTTATYYYPDENRNFNFAGMCKAGTVGQWGANTCIPSYASGEYQKYLMFIVKKAIDLGIQDFDFGQVYLCDNMSNPVLPSLLAQIRQYAASKGKEIVIGGQTNDVQNENYLRSFDFIFGGVGIKTDGVLETGACASKYPGMCWALEWNPTFASKANDVLINLDWDSSNIDDTSQFVKMSQSLRASSLANYYNFFKNKGMGFLMPFLTPLTGNENGCFGQNKWQYSPDNKFTCKDEDAINQILGVVVTKKPDLSVCTAAAECLSNVCLDGYCGLKPDGWGCGSNDVCKSNNCQAGKCVTLTTQVTISGTLKKNTGEGISNVTIDLCGSSVTATTDSIGNWSKVLNAGDAYCARVTAGLSAGYSAITATSDNSCHTNNASYEWQYAGQNKFTGCSAANEGSWDLASDSNINFTVTYPTACTANTTSGCKVCKADGSGWVDTDSKCATGEFCINGTCSFFKDPPTTDDYKPQGTNYSSDPYFDNACMMKWNSQFTRGDQLGWVPQQCTFNNGKGNLISINTSAPANLDFDTVSIADGLKPAHGAITYKNISGQNVFGVNMWAADETGGSSVSVVQDKDMGQGIPTGLTLADNITFTGKFYLQSIANAGWSRFALIFTLLDTTTNKPKSAEFDLWDSDDMEAWNTVHNGIKFSYWQDNSLDYAVRSQSRYLGQNIPTGQWLTESITTADARRIFPELDPAKTIIKQAFITFEGKSSKSAYWVQNEVLWSPGICAPNSVSGCQVCKADGSGWADTDFKCASGQICLSGACVSTCVAKTCASQGYGCGSVSDGCGRTLDCGICASGQTCSAGTCVDAISGGGAGSSGGGGSNANPTVRPTVTKPVVKMTRVEILAAIAKIQALIADLQKQLAAMGGGTTTFSCTQIAKNLFYGMANDAQVKCLQEVLKNQSYAVTASGNYDAATKTAVVQFQQKYASEILAPYHLTRGSGNVGNATRAKINQIIIQ